MNRQTPTSAGSTPAIDGLVEWIQRWRSLILIMIPEINHTFTDIPQANASAHNIVRVAELIVNFIQKDPETQSFRNAALHDLGKKLEKASQEAAQASTDLLIPSAAHYTYHEACRAANEVLIRGINLIRSVFGAKSKEYEQFKVPLSGFDLNKPVKK